jgi:hypothetical protein
MLEHRQLLAPDANQQLSTQSVLPSWGGLGGPGQNAYLATLSASQLSRSRKLAAIIHTSLDSSNGCSAPEGLRHVGLGLVGKRALLSGPLSLPPMTLTQNFFLASESSMARAVISVPTTKKLLSYGLYYRGQLPELLVGSCLCTLS